MSFQPRCSVLAEKPGTWSPVLCSKRENRDFFQSKDGHRKCIGTWCVRSCCKTYSFRSLRGHPEGTFPNWPSGLIWRYLFKWRIWRKLIISVQVHAAQAAMAAGGVKAENISSVCIGNVLSASSADAPYLARHVALRCGLAVPTPALIGT